MKSENNIYFIDSSALITINRYYPSSIFPDLWKHLEELFRQQKMFSHDMVFDEIVSYLAARQDDLTSRFVQSLHEWTTNPNV